MVHESLEDAQRNHEGIDVENGDVRFFDEAGCSLEVVFTQENRRTKLLGVVEIVQQGQFTVRPAASPDPTEFRSQVLRDVAYLHPNRWFASLDALRERFSGRTA